MLMRRARKSVVGMILVLLVSCGGGGGGGQTNPPVNNPPAANCLSRATFGDSTTSSYILPFPVGESSEVLQAYCTSGSHSEQLAYDFIRPFGSEVSAVRDGEVMTVVSHHPDFTTNEIFNYINVRHDDGTTAFYAHLQQGSTVVAVGDFVFAGQMIGLNGSSGTPTACDTFILNPPRDQCAVLHFGVYATYPAVHGNDVAINFRNADGTLDTRGGLTRGQIYTALSF